MTLAENLSMGFALPSPTHKNKICKEARDYVEVIFSLGMGAWVTKEMQQLLKFARG